MDLPENEVWALRASNILIGICQAMELNRAQASPIPELPLRVALEEATLFFVEAQRKCGRETKVDLVFFLSKHPNQVHVALAQLMPAPAITAPSVALSVRAVNVLRQIGKADDSARAIWRT